MRRRVLLLTAALGLVAASLSYPTLASESCEECASFCNTIPMATEDCLLLYCPACAGSSSPGGASPTVPGTKPN